MIKEVMDRDFHCMTRIPKENKCQIECLLEYRFDGQLFTTLDYNQEWDLLLFGNTKGQILGYFLKVSVDQSYNSTVEKIVEPTIVSDKNTTQKDGEQILNLSFSQIESKLPVYMMKKTTLKKEPGNEQKVDSEELVQF